MRSRRNSSSSSIKSRVRKLQRPLSAASKPATLPLAEQTALLLRRPECLRVVGASCRLQVACERRANRRRGALAKAHLGARAQPAGYRRADGPINFAGQPGGRATRIRLVQDDTQHCLALAVPHRSHDYRKKSKSTAEAANVLRVAGCAR